MPVRGGLILNDPPIVVTQPSPGRFRAFSSLCTHQGCPVTRVVDNEIRCPCHGSVFAAATGAVTSGPARSPLRAKKVTERANAIYIT